MPALTVNVTCVDCSGDPPCAVCRAVARAITASGHRVEHTTRYAALRAAASGTYGFDACVVPIGANERAVADAVRALLPSQCVALVAEERDVVGRDLPPNYVFISGDDYRNGNFPPEWLSAAAQSRSVRDRRPRAGATFPLAAQRVAALAARARTASAGSSRVALDPDLALDDEIAWAATCSAPFAIVLIRLPGLPERSSARADKSRQTFDAAAQVIASVVRQGDAIGARSDEFLLVLPEADDAGATAVAGRIAEAIARAPFDARLPSKRSPGAAAGWTIGVAAFPSHGKTRAGLLARAAENSKPLI